MSIAHGELGRTITRHIEIAAKSRRMLGGRRALRLVYGYYRTSGEAGSLYDLEDLMAIFYSGDGKLEAFMNSWDQVLTGMEEEPPESTLRTLFHRQIKNSHVIKFHIDIYDRCSAGDDSYTDAFLRK